MAFMRFEKVYTITTQVKKIIKAVFEIYNRSLTLKAT
jgi:hypothetical protein